MANLREFHEKDESACTSKHENSRVHAHLGVEIRESGCVLAYGSKKLKHSSNEIGAGRRGAGVGGVLWRAGGASQR